MDFGNEVFVRRAEVRVPTMAIAVIVSLLLHVALMVGLPRFKQQQDEPPVPPPMQAYLRPAPAEKPAPAKPQPRVTPPPKAAAKPPVALPTTPPPARPAPPVTPPPAPKPPILAIPRPTPTEAPVVATPPPPRPEPPPVAVTPPAPPPAEADFMASVRARQRARGEVSPEEKAAAEAEQANRAAIASAALKSAPPISFADKKPTPSGGTFQIRRRGFDYAEFMFYGWNENFRRAGPQLIEVRLGNNPDIDIAVVRRIIELIRVHERADFQWYSHRSGRNHTLSARARDNGSLESFMMSEFYDDLHRYR